MTNSNNYRPTISHTAEKNWADNDDAAQIRPESIQVQLYNDDIKYGAPVTLDEANGWSYTWSGLNEHGDWHADEVQVPDGYTKDVVTSGTTTTITNTYVPPVDPELPVEIPEEPPVVEIPEEEPPLVDIPDEDIPLGDIPETGDASAAWFVLSALSGTGLFLTRKKREDE